jgi:hypothetical protein
VTQDLLQGQDVAAVLDEVAYPQYRWWLTTGEVMPEIGQTSPEYDEANRNLTSQDVG